MTSNVNQEILQALGDFLGINKEKRNTEVSFQKESLGKTILIFDMMYMFKSHASVSTIVRNDGTPFGGCLGALNKIAVLTEQFSADKVVCVFDGSNSHQKRRLLNENYKQNRGGLAKLNMPFYMSDAEKEENLKLQQIYLIKILRHLPVYLLQEVNEEADDIIAYLTREYFKDNGNNIIVSADKDYLQLVDKHTKVFNPDSRVNMLYTTENAHDVFGVPPINIPILKAIAGDKSDNILGVRGVGEKTILKYFPELCEKAFQLNEFVELLRQRKQEHEGMKKLGKKLVDLLNAEDILKQNYEVCQLLYNTLSMSERQRLLKSMKLPRVDNAMRFGLRDFLRDNELSGLISAHKFDYFYNNLV